MTIDLVREARRWVDDQEAKVPPPARIGSPAFRVSRMEAFVAGSQWAFDEASKVHHQEQDDWSVESATGQRQLDDATALMREAAELFRAYEKHHRDIAKRTGAKTGREEKADRNALAASRLEAWLDGKDRYPVGPGEESCQTVEATFDAWKGPKHVYFTGPPLSADQAAKHSRPGWWDKACGFDPASIRADIADNGDLVPTEFHRTLADCRAQFETGRFGGFPSARPATEDEEEAEREEMRFEQRVEDQARDDEEEQDRAVDLSNVRPVTNGPLADPEVADALAGVIDGKAVKSLSTVRDGTFRLQTPDPRFDPAKPVLVNGYRYHPATEAK